MPAGAELAVAEQHVLAPVQIEGGSRHLPPHMCPTLTINLPLRAALQAQDNEINA